MINVEHERGMVCCRCKTHLIVGGFVDDLDPAAYVGISCGCRKLKQDDAPSNALEALGRARTAQEARRG